MSLFFNLTLFYEKGAGRGIPAPICYENRWVNPRNFHATSIEACFMNFTSKKLVNEESE